MIFDLERTGSWADSQDDQVIAVDDFSSRQSASLDFLGRKPRDAAGKFSAIEVADSNDIAGGESAFALPNARRKETPTAVAQGLLRALVHSQETLGMMEKGDPSFAALELCGVRNEQCALL